MSVKKLNREIKKLLNENQQPEEKQVVDEIGKFFVVKKPYNKCTKEDIVSENTCFDDINKDEVIGIYKNRSDANRIATLEIKNYSDTLKELESKMSNFREQKKSLEAQRNETKDLLKSLK